MIQQIRNSKVSKVIATYLALMIFVESTQPMMMFALTSGPTQPEFNSFTPISTSDMVDLSSGDFNYNIPIMDVGGYPLNLSYSSGITMDQEASWVGLGWNLNVGQISRQVRGLPDDFRGDKMHYDNDLKENQTIGTNFNVSPGVFGADLPFNFGLGVQYNNNEGISCKPSLGVSYQLSENVQVGANLTGSVAEGATLTPSVSISKTMGGVFNAALSLSGSYNSRKGFETLNMSASGSIKNQKGAEFQQKNECGESETWEVTSSSGGSLGSLGGSLSFNNQSYTPTKRVGYVNNNKTFNATLGGELFGIEGLVRTTGYGSFQRIADAYKSFDCPAFGYENTQYKNNSNGVLDFNREKEQTVNKNTNVLPVTNYTYDIYSIQGQGASGMFRPYRSQVGYLYNDDVRDESSSSNFGIEIGALNLIKAGSEINISNSVSRTGMWYDDNYAYPSFKESDQDVNKPLYQHSVFKMVGELNVDSEQSIYQNRLKAGNPLRVSLGGSGFNVSAQPSYLAKIPGNNPPESYNTILLDSKIKRSERLFTNQSVQKVTSKESDEKFIFKNQFSEPHHNAGIKILQTDGTTYVYGKTAYNKEKIEATFDVSGRSGDINTGLVGYNGALYGNGQQFSDRFVNKIKTPAYAHTYLISSILSTDYQDLTNNGLSDDDLGGYTKFDYSKSLNDGYVENYQWRIPYGQNTASYNEGLKSSQKDQKGSYVYGKKEIVYVRKIETKTHIAFIDLSTKFQRKDARGTTGESGGNVGDNGAYMSFIKSIRLYSKPEIMTSGTPLSYFEANVLTYIKPIKTAHFEYGYELCNNTPNNYNSDAAAKGKLTLKKVYFTYQHSNMGKFTPYTFTYNNNNPNYSSKGFDIWGNYKPNNTSLNNTDFPFAEQNRALADENTAAWTLKSVQLPSGGTITITTESDDYKYVQNKKAMQMFKVVGAGRSQTPSTNSVLFFGNLHSNYLYVQVPDINATSSEFISKYLSENLNNAIYFKFLLSMNGNSDYVNGYFEIDQSRINDLKVTNGVASIPMKLLQRDGSNADSQGANPISKAGWGFGRTYLNRVVFGGGEEVNDDFESIVVDLVESIWSMTTIFQKENTVLQSKGIANSFVPNNSWIRLENPNGHKLGGGSRVKKIELSDNWDVMTDNIANPIYSELYGQEYKYTQDDSPNSDSSGVASYEPNSSPENPFVLPFYGYDTNYQERIGAPKENNYVETPFGETFFPSPKITYSRVLVSNLKKENSDSTKSLKKHATGSVVTEHYTTYDFPTISDFTEIDIRPEDERSSIWNILNVTSKDQLVASQGFSIETNDMDGKVKAQKVYPEGENQAPISKVEYKYSIDKDFKLDNNLTTIDEKGKVSRKLLGVDYDVINDFNESSSITYSAGADANLASFLIFVPFPIPIFVPMIIPKQAGIQSVMKLATTTKVVHKTGILVEKIAYDLGSRVSTKNLAWDANTGQILLTQTINEFDDKYYSFNYPAYWNYNSMGMACKNIGLEGKIKPLGAGYNFKGHTVASTAIPTILAENINTYFRIGDELMVEGTTGAAEKLWVVGLASNQLQLMNSLGISNTITNESKFKIVRSGNKNQQMASMASVTSMINPIDTNNDGFVNDFATSTYDYSGTGTNPRIINASAIQYSQDWASQCENGLPNELGFTNGDGNLENPYLFNIKGNWRPIKSYAYLTGRNNNATTNRRNSGFFTKFKPFYSIDAAGKWNFFIKDWTGASEVTKISPYGTELENKDALERYSSAQYGYNYTLPVAVASNSQYQEMGFDGFEDYNPLYLSSPAALKPHFGFNQSISKGGEVRISDKAHTGRNSIAVQPGSKATLITKIDGCKTITTIN